MCARRSGGVGKIWPRVSSAYGFGRLSNIDPTSSLGFGDKPTGRQADWATSRLGEKPIGRQADGVLGADPLYQDRFGDIDFTSAVTMSEPAAIPAGMGCRENAEVALRARSWIRLGVWVAVIVVVAIAAPPQCYGHSARSGAGFVESSAG